VIGVGPAEGSQFRSRLATTVSAAAAAAAQHQHHQLQYNEHHEHQEHQQIGEFTQSSHSPLLGYHVAGHSRQGAALSSNNLSVSVSNNNIGMGNNSNSNSNSTSMSDNNIINNSMGSINQGSDPSSTMPFLARAAYLSQVANASQHSSSTQDQYGSESQEFFSDMTDYEDGGMGGYFDARHASLTVQERGHLDGESTPLLNQHSQVVETSCYESLNYDPVCNNLYQSEIEGLTTYMFRKIVIFQWLLMLIIGAITGLIAFGIDNGVDFLFNTKINATENVRHHCGDCFWSPFLVYCSICGLFTLVAAFLVCCVESVSAGSGIPEIKCYLNGVKVARVVRIKTLLCKVFGVLFSVAAGLAVGKEGPMIHSGAVVGAGVSQGKSSTFGFESGLLKTFRTDPYKRDFVTGGAAAGVAAAFGAPVGGVLFSLEEGASFWNQSLTWRTLFCAVISAFTLNFFRAGISGSWGELSNPGLIDFGTFSNNLYEGYNATQIPFFLLLGVFGGLTGSLFNFLNHKLTIFRRRFIIRSPARRLVEAVSIALLTAVLSFTMSAFAQRCNVPSALDPSWVDYQEWCPDGTFNDMAALFYTPQQTAIKNLFHMHTDFSYQTLCCFLVVYFVLACLTYGMGIPSGLFVPTLLIGATFGRIAGQLLATWLPDWQIDPGTFALIGAASFLGGVVRMTISLTVILMEATNNVTYGLPIMFAIMAAKLTGDYFTESLYDIHIELQEIPLLDWEPPRYMRKFRVTDVMASPVICLKQTVRVRQVLDLLRVCDHNGFPVVSRDKGKFSGLILRSQLITLLRVRAFFDGSEVRNTFYQLATGDDFLQDYPRYPSIDSVFVPEEEMDLYIDLTAYMNPVPYSVQPECPLERAFRLFRTMGLRHLPVVDDSNVPIGIITRKNLTHMEKHYTIVGGRFGK